MDDLISRQAAIDALRRAEALTRAFGYHNVIETIRELPSAQPERKKGKWEEKEVIHEVEASTAIDEWQSARCSVCGKYHTTPYMYYFDEFNFCPNCGADMRGEE